MWPRNHWECEILSAFFSSPFRSSWFLTFFLTRLVFPVFVVAMSLAFLSFSLLGSASHAHRRQTPNDDVILRARFRTQNERAEGRRAKRTLVDTHRVSAAMMIFHRIRIYVSSTNETKFSLRLFFAARIIGRIVRAVVGRAVRSKQPNNEPKHTYLFLNTPTPLDGIMIIVIRNYDDDIMKTIRFAYNTFEQYSVSRPIRERALPTFDTLLCST